MKRYAKMLFSDLCIAAAAVVMYSPGLLALRPTDESIIRAGFSIVGGIVIAYSLFRVNFGESDEEKLIDAGNVHTRRRQCSTALETAELSAR